MRGNIFEHAFGPRRQRRAVPVTAGPPRPSVAPAPPSPRPVAAVANREGTSWPRRAVLLAVAFAVFTRRPDQWARPQFWAEDAVVLFNQAWHDGVASLFRPHPAYFVFYQRAAAWLASLFPAAWTPGLYAAATLAATLGAAAFILRARLRGVGERGKALLALALVAVPHGGEVFGTLINTQWLLAPTLWVLILQEPARARREATVDFAVLAVAGLTGPFIVLFAPWFLLRWRGGGWRRGYDFWLVAAAMVLAAVQAGSIAWHGPVARTALATEAGRWLKALGFQLPAGLFFGASVPHYLGGAFFVLTPLLLAAGAWSLARAERERAVAAVVVLGGGLTVYASGIYQTGGPRPDLYSPFGAVMRYFYLFYVAAAWAAVFLWHDRRSPAVRRAAGISLLAMALASASAWTAPALTRFDWGKYARQMDAGEPVVVAPVNPPGWTVEVRARRRP